MTSTLPQRKHCYGRTTIVPTKDDRLLLAVRVASDQIAQLKRDIEQKEQRIKFLSEFVEDEVVQQQSFWQWVALGVAVIAFIISRS